MITCSPELAIELCSSLLFLIYVVSKPKSGFILVGVVSVWSLRFPCLPFLFVSAAYLKTYGLVSPWDMVQGETSKASF